MRRITSGSHVILLAGLLAAMVPAADYPSLVESKLDVVLLNGGQPISGFIKETRADGTVVIDCHGTVQAFPKSRYERIEPRILAGDSVKRRGAVVLKARDWDDVLRTVQWGVKHQAKTESLELARAALAAEPAQPKLAEATLALLRDPELKTEPKVIEEIIRSVLKADSHWRDGRRMLIATLTEAGGRDADVEAALAEWLEFAATEPEPLRAMVAIHEKKGDTRSAVNMMRRLWESAKNSTDGIDYARLLFRIGDFKRAQEVAGQLIDQEATAGTAKAIIGSIRLIAGKTDESEPLLRAASTVKLPEDLAPVAAYNLALACYRMGKMDEARMRWSALDHPMARYALAVLDRQPVTDVEALKPIAAQVQLHNAMLDIETHPGSQPVLEGMTTPATAPVRFVQAVAAAFRTGAGPETVRTLGEFPGVVSLRWQAYAHLVNKRFDAALTVLDQLPPEDGYAIAYRLHIALERKDTSAANDCWSRLQSSSNPPRDWMARMQLVFDAAQHENLLERFDLEGVTPPSGWVYHAFGTGIQVHQQGGRLWLEGKQRKSAEAVTRAWRLVKRDQLKRVIADFDIAAIGNAIAGIEILDGQRRSGVALGVKADRTVSWRQRGANGPWSDWTPLAMKTGDGLAKLAVEYTNGQAKVFQIDAPDKVELLGTWDGRGGKTNELCVALFGSADEGQEWKVGVDEVRIELNSKVRSRTE